MDFLKNISDSLHYFIRENFAPDIVLVSQITAKVLFFVLFIFLMDTVMKFLFTILIKGILKKFDSPIFKSIYQSKVYRSFAHFIPVLIGKNAVYDIFYKHPKSYGILETTLDLLLVYILGVLFTRVLKAIEEYYRYTNDHYGVTGIRTLSQTIRILGFIILGFVVIMVIFRITPGKIFTTLGAMTAIILLVFRDTILGFVTGIHVSTSKNLKVGDWVGIPKYNIEGNILEINLLTTKIQNFDKTISTIPTYDLLSTEIKNHQVMADGSLRRIKRSIYFNIKTFKFVDQNLYDRLKSINLISDYVTKRYNEILDNKSRMDNSDKIINGEQLTNIGVFRHYTLEYLRHNPRIDHQEMILVRQLEITPQGMPLEIYCFANKSKLVDYENIQADIFDHILTAAAEFDLEIMQVAVPSK